MLTHLIILSPEKFHPWSKIKYTERVNKKNWEHLGAKFLWLEHTSCSFWWDWTMVRLFYLVHFHSSHPFPFMGWGQWRWSFPLQLSALYPLVVDLPGRQDPWASALRPLGKKSAISKLTLGFPKTRSISPPINDRSRISVPLWLCIQEGPFPLLLSEFFQRLLGFCPHSLYRDKGSPTGRTYLFCEKWKC